MKKEEEGKTQQSEKKKKPQARRKGVLGIVEWIVGPLTWENAVSWVKTIAVLIPLVLLFRYFAFEPFKIPSGSMIDTLLINDKIIVNKFTYGFRIPFTGKRFLKTRDIQRGDIVVFKAPESASKERKNFVKRVVALPGERVKINDGHICINGERVTSPPEVADRIYTNGGSLSKYGTAREVRVPDGQVYVLGDNSGSSRDSRYWGYVPVEDVKGPAVAIWWPPWRIQRLK